MHTPPNIAHPFHFHTKLARTHCPHPQVVRLLERAFKASGLPAYLCPYGCLPTGYECGIIEVVPNTKSRCVGGWAGAQPRAAGRLPQAIPNAGTCVPP